jgi:hypothetical protein
MGIIYSARDIIQGLDPRVKEKVVHSPVTGEALTFLAIGRPKGEGED